MTSEKKLTILRVIIFTVIAYGIVIVSTSIFGYMEDTIGWRIFGFFGIAFAPAAANFLTRLITKEGFHDKLYAANFRGNMKYYVLAAVLPVAAYFISANIGAGLFVPDYRITDVLNKDTAPEFIYTVLYVISTSVLLFPLFFGEEYGWRAYLTPKLETLMPKPAALIVSGIIWGMWHAPIVYLGHNFGTSYSFYPYGGYITMSVFCIFMGCLLTWLTEKTGSVYPACICHSVNNNICNVMLYTFVQAGMSEEAFLSRQFEIVIVHMLPLTVMCIPFVLLLFFRTQTDDL